MFIHLHAVGGIDPARKQLPVNRFQPAIRVDHRGEKGRKFGVGVGLVSQRPGKLDADVLSQCNTTCLLRIINPVDQQKVRESVESVGQELLRELPALSKGQAIIAGAAVNTPILCQVRPRQTPHLAQDIATPEVWREAFEKKG